MICADVVSSQMWVVLAQITNPRVDNRRRLTESRGQTKLLHANERTTKICMMFICSFEIHSTYSSP